MLTSMTTISHKSFMTELGQLTFKLLHVLLQGGNLRLPSKHDYMIALIGCGRKIGRTKKDGGYPDPT